MATSQQIEHEIGQRLARLRLARNVTQTDLAEKAGIGVRTLRRLEAGDPSTLDTFLRVAAALDLEHAILSVLPEGDIRPIERVSQKGKERRRASPASEQPKKSSWTWGDDVDD
ncbi:MULTISPECIES: helix-turn-helix domain-containing protein [Alphaproteobacteria]|uniref:Transcriptional regulator n=1 Tax=Pseudooceanicola lipolyticus TaxID=2029104 RepID=A0A2M8J6B6_9RHOB|nr:helix-turn-helix domain-containing protein [Salipiger bermudensis]PJE38331.1 transcriptional regulator [Pseudooceanicola lipolyticus]